MNGAGGAARTLLALGVCLAAWWLGGMLAGWLGLVVLDLPVRAALVLGALAAAERLDRRDAPH